MSRVPQIKPDQHMPPIEWMHDRYLIDRGILKYSKNVAKFKAGATVGSFDTRGYLMTAVSYGGRRRTLMVHRIIMALKLGRTLTSSEEVDHIDRDITNNHPDNLRLSTRRENMLNSSRQRMGVTTKKYGDKIVYCAQIGHKGKITCLGHFADQAEAQDAYFKAAKRLMPENGYQNILRDLNDPAT